MQRILFIDDDVQLCKLLDEMIGRLLTIAKLDISTPEVLSEPARFRFITPIKLMLIRLCNGWTHRDAPSTLYDMTRAVGVTIESSAEPLNMPWWAAPMERLLGVSASGRRSRRLTRLSMRAYSSQLIRQAPKHVSEPAPGITGTDAIIVAPHRYPSPRYQSAITLEDFESLRVSRMPSSPHCNVELLRRASMSV